MKRNIIKIFTVFCLVIIIASLSFSVKALSVTMSKEAIEAERQAKNAVNNFLSNLENGKTSTYNYIDKNNSELYKQLQNKLNSYSKISYEIKKLSKTDDIYDIEMKISVEGTDAKVSGITADFKVKEVNGTFKVIDTDFFDVTSAEYVFGIVFGVFGIVIFVLAIIFAFIAISVIVVIVVVVNCNKKKK